jgi:orotidine-5'-phosphate decarboxylase
MSAIRSAPFLDTLRSAAESRRSRLCVGLDPDPEKMPASLAAEGPAGIQRFCEAIVEATADLAAAFKPQIAYFAAAEALPELKAVIASIRSIDPAIPVILDSKRGDIGATARQYARESFAVYQADATTISPYLGGDSLAPFLADPGRGAFSLCRTSNPGGADLQALEVPATDDAPAEPLYLRVARLAANRWNANRNLGLVVGATWPEELQAVATLAPELPLLIPGVGAQGGDPKAVDDALWAANHRAPVLINASRSILYADASADGFAQAARDEATRLRSELGGFAT